MPNSITRKLDLTSRINEVCFSLVNEVNRVGKTNLGGAEFAYEVGE